MSKRTKLNRSNESYFNLQRDLRLSGTPRPIKPIEDSIERTQEYNDFMKDLEEFHKAHGTPLQKEPVLGSKKLDLYRIYNMVIENGGCEKICLEKSWKKICEPFNFPATCTNSAYVMKNVYIKFLEAYELEKHWGKKVPYGGIPQRPQTTPSTPQVIQAVQSPVPQYLEMSTPPSRRIVPQDNVQANYSDPETPVQTYNNYDSGTPIAYNNHDTMADPIAIQTTVNVLIYTKAFFLEADTIISQLPNEIDWAFEVLVQLSADDTINFYLDKIPGLVDVILSFVAPFYKDIRKFTGTEPGSMLTIDSEKDTELFVSSVNEFLSLPVKIEQLSRVQQIFLMFRNLSYTEHNMKFMAGYKPLRRFLVEALSLPEISRLSELKLHCLETLANLCRIITLKSSKEELVMNLSKLLYSKDSLIVLLSINAMTNLAANGNNADHLQEIDPVAVQRLAQLLLVDDDDELILSVLDWFYQYTTYENSAYAIIQYAPNNFIRLLINFLRYGANDEDFLQDQRTSAERNPYYIRGDFENYPEPYRTHEWLKLYYVESPFDGVLQTDIWYAYRDQFMNSHFPMMPAAEVIKHVNQAFPESRIKRKPLPEEVTLKNPTYKCRWLGCRINNFVSENELYNHVISDHINNSPDARYECHWMGCHRFPVGSDNRLAVIAHLKTHFPVSPDEGDNRKRKAKSPKMKALNKYGKNNGIITHRTYVTSDMNGDAIGIPLTASLILRNLSIFRKNLHYFEAYEQELTDMLANCVGLSKHLAETLSNLKSV
ncbi:8073_t:CDS:2 [Acaulospora morrowiae]|uniref:8073_t:CDS:1 n=1 Tax=Acaulospora morrowiae TaxID=94023 RepID=A0A9N8YX70_9GLOM|nr:8073_t:CDS:2 [Acaulospora morrowiae]